MMINAGAIQVSVCCLTYNHEAYIEDALRGFVMQETAFPYEIVIHDDASTDRTLEILLDWQYAHPRLIRVLVERENQYQKHGGVYPFWSRLYPAARGRYIAECDGDDYWTDPRKLQLQWEYMEAHERWSLCHHDYLILEDATGELRRPHRTNPSHYTQRELIGFSGDGYSIHTSCKFWRNVYDPSRHAFFAPFWGDFPVTTLMGVYGEAGYVPGIRPSVFRHRHPGSSWTGLPPDEIARLTEEMRRRINGAIGATGNPDWMRIRRGGA